MTTIRDNSMDTTRVAAFVAVADRSVWSIDSARPWIRAQTSQLPAGQTMDDMLAGHPVFGRIVGLAAGNLRVDGESISIRSISVYVGAEPDVLSSARDLLVEEGSARTVMYDDGPCGVDRLLFRLLVTHCLPAATTASGCPLPHIENLATTLSLEDRVPRLPLDVAVAGLAAGTVYPLSTTKDIAKAHARDDYGRITREVMSRLNMTAALFCELTGVGAARFRPAKIDVYGAIRPSFGNS